MDLSSAMICLRPHRCRVVFAHQDNLQMLQVSSVKMVTDFTSTAWNGGAATKESKSLSLASRVTRTCCWMTNRWSLVELAIALGIGLDGRFHVKTTLDLIQDSEVLVHKALARVSIPAKLTSLGISVAAAVVDPMGDRGVGDQAALEGPAQRATQVVQTQGFLIQCA